MEEVVKLKASIKEEELDLILNVKAGRVAAEIAGRRYDLEVHEFDESSYLIFAGTRVYVCRVDASRNSRETFDVGIRDHRHAVTIVDPRKTRSVQETEIQEHGSTEIIAPMPGKIVRLLVETGATVEKDAGIVVIEAMKMQNEMRSPRAGIVSLRIEAGDTVNAGDVMATVE
jgi:biotin carboxyl carrier protein